MLCDTVVAPLYRVFPHYSTTRCALIRNCTPRTDDVVDHANAE